MSDLHNKVIKATRWSAMTELAAKLLTPIVNMVLARLLTPEAFGVVATLTMVITFAEIFTDAGFQKYLIQHDFQDGRDREESTTVAFWTNLMMSVLLWGIIIVFADPLAALVGNPGLGYVLVVACAGIPIAAFSSIQMALYKRDLDFKTLFKVRLIGILVPVFVTVPLAVIFRSFWALVIGTLVKDAVNAFVLTYFSKWKPHLFYSFGKLKEMISFTVWSIAEQVCIWLTAYVDVFIVGRMLSQHYLGLYKTSSTLVGQLMGLVTAITTPILFSSLSKLQNDGQAFQSLFYRFQKVVSLLIMPIGVGIFLFKDFITNVILGGQWMEASGFIGLWALTSAITIVLSYYSSEVYRAKGKPRLSVLAQLLHLVVLWPVVLIAVRYGFETLYTARSLVRFEGILVDLLLMTFVIGISGAKMFVNVAPSMVSAAAMAVLWLVLPPAHAVWQNILYIVLCALCYMGVISLYPKERQMLLHLRQVVRNRP